MLRIGLKCVATFWWLAVTGFAGGLGAQVALSHTFLSLCGWFLILLAIVAAPLGVWLLWRSELRSLFQILTSKECTKHTCNCKNDSH